MNIAMSEISAYHEAGHAFMAIFANAFLSSTVTVHGKTVVVPGNSEQ